MNIKYVRLGGKNRPIQFGLNTFSEFGEITNRTSKEIENLKKDELTMKEVLTIWWCALKHGAKIENYEFNYTIEDVGNWLDENPEVFTKMDWAVDEIQVERSEKWQLNSN